MPRLKIDEKGPSIAQQEIYVRHKILECQMRKRNIVRIYREPFEREISLSER